MLFRSYAISKYDAFANELFDYNGQELLICGNNSILGVSTYSTSFNFLSPDSTFEDKFINGKSFDFFYNRGNEPNSTKKDDNNDEKMFFKKGDTIVVRFCTIDRANFQFWRDEETQVSNNGNPFAELMETVKYCSLGQITHALYEVGGQYRRNM